MPKGRRMGRRENKARFRKSAGVKSRSIPGTVFMRGGDPRF